MKIPLQTVILFCIVGATAFAQKQTNVWYFGYGAAIDFSGGAPVALSNSVMRTQEGCASIADRQTGQLLFYTEGATVWNRNNVPMPNGTGLFGQYSSTQSAVIIPMPGDATKYYVFTSDQGGYAGPNKGVHYSIVDMTLDGGLGAVTTKNIFLLQPATEKLAAVVHCDGKSVWVVAHGWQNNKFYAWRVAGSGITDTVVSSVGAIHNGGYDGTIGYLKSSPDGKHLALAAYSINIVQLFDFDNSTGIVSNPLTLPATGFDYGVSFSPDNSRLYVTSSAMAPTKAVYQFNLLAGSPTAIAASRKTIFSSGSEDVSALQIAPDGRIYITKYSNDSLDVIINPNALGAACNYRSNAVPLAPGTGGMGLPDFVESFFSASIVAGFTADTACASDTVCFFGNGVPSPDRWLWRFGDPSSGIGDTSGEQNPKHYYETAGEYIVTLIVDRGCLHDSVSKKIIIPQKTTTCINVTGFTQKVPGDELSIPVVVSNASSIAKIDIEIFYEPHLLRVKRAPTTDIGIISDFNNDQGTGRLSFTVTFTSTLTAKEIEVARLHLEAMLSLRDSGSIEVMKASITRNGKIITSQGCSVPFVIDEGCIHRKDLRQRNAVTIEGIYPNPSHDITTIVVNADGSPMVKIDVFDAFGRRVEVIHDGVLTSGKHELRIATEQYANGIYFCRIIQEGKVISREFNVRR